MQLLIRRRNVNVNLVCDGAAPPDESVGETRDRQKVGGVGLTSESSPRVADE